MEDAYVDHFGEYAEWNQLHDLSEWQPRSARHAAGSEGLQRAHFQAFFRAQHPLRHPADLDMSLVDLTARVLNGLRRWGTGVVWLRFHRAIRMQAYLKRRVCGRSRAVAAERVRVLEGWLAYWHDAETKAQEDLRTRMRSTRGVGTMNAEKAGQVAVAQLMVSTPEEVKVQVLWELYWLLHAQVGMQTKAYCKQWLALQLKRRLLAGRVRPSIDPHFAAKADPDFYDNKPCTLRAVNAALFVLALRPPRFRYRAGIEVTFRELVRLANAPHVMHRPGDAEPKLKHASSVVTAFLDSHLCHSAQWLAQRHGAATPLVPPLSWHAEAKSSRRSSTEQSAGEEDEGEEEPPPAAHRLEQRLSLLQLRRLGTPFGRTVSVSRLSCPLLPLSSSFDCSPSGHLRPPTSPPMGLRRSLTRTSDRSPMLRQPSPGPGSPGSRSPRLTPLHSPREAPPARGPALPRSGPASPRRGGGSPPPIDPSRLLVPGPLLRALSRSSTQMLEEDSTLGKAVALPHVRPSRSPTARLR
eukprot:EG_transcript_6964